jgi:hypothetical protein
MNSTSEIAMTRKALQETSGRPKTKNKKGLKFLFCAGGALFIGLAILGTYSRNAWTLEVQRHTDLAAHTIVHVVHPTRAIEANIAAATRSDHAIHRRTDLCPGPVAICRSNC